MLQSLESTGSTARQAAAFVVAVAARACACAAGSAASNGSGSGSGGGGATRLALPLAEAMQRRVGDTVLLRCGALLQEPDCTLVYNEQREAGRRLQNDAASLAAQLRVVNPSMAGALMQAAYTLPEAKRLVRACVRDARGVRVARQRAPHR